MARAGLLRQAVTNGVMSKLGVGAHLHLVEDARPIGADCLDAQRQFRRDFRHGLAAADHAQHLIFAIRQAFVRPIIAIGMQTESDVFENIGSEVFAAAHQLRDRRY